MSNDPVPGGDRIPPELQALLRSIFGADAEEAIEALEASGFDAPALLRQAGLGDGPEAMAGLIAQIRMLMSASPEDPVNWRIAQDLARQTAVAEGDPAVLAPEARSVVEALTVAELWLDRVCELPAAAGRMQALSRSEWVEATLPAWRAMCEPIARSVADALAEALAAQAREHPGMPEATSDAGALLRVLGGTVFGMQVGQAVGMLSREVFGLTDVGLPLVAGPTTALVPSGVDAFGRDLDNPPSEVLLFLAVREAAHARLFTHVPWLGAHLKGAVEAYARGISIDTDRLEEAVRSVDPTDPAALQEALSTGVFAMEPTEDQRRALTRLETALALVEGWVEEVAYAATKPNLPDVDALQEMIRRRRAAGGPAEHTFATLVGLEMRPRRAREAADLWAAVTEELGPLEREAVWDHPDLLPTPEDLDDPTGFVRRRAEPTVGDDMDAEIARLLGGQDDPPGPGPGPQA